MADELKQEGEVIVPAKLEPSNDIPGIVKDVVDVPETPVETVEDKPDEPYMKFDPSKGTCAEMCATDIQIYLPNLLDKTQSGTCEFCNPTCSKCAGTVNTCSLCQPGYVLNLDFTCQKTCNNPDGTQALD